MATDESAFQNSVTLDDNDRASILLIALTKTAIAEVDALAAASIPTNTTEAMAFLQRCHGLLARFKGIQVERR